MRPALFALAAVVGLFALGGRGCWFHGDSQSPATAAVPVRPAVIERVIDAKPSPIAQAPCLCPNGGDCGCKECICTKVVAKPAVVTPAKIVPAALVKRAAKAPPRTVCTPQGCFAPTAAAKRTYASGSCAGGSCASYGGPVRNFVGRGPVRRFAFRRFR